MTILKKKISQQPNHFAYSVPAGDDFIATDVTVDCGGILLANQGANSILLTRVASTGQPKGAGVYAVVLATKPVKMFRWDNTGLKHEIVSGDEAALRIMGRAESCLIENVNFRCRKWTDPKTKRVDWWKQGVQIRDVDVCSFVGGQIIGPIDVGQQKNTAKTKQRVAFLSFGGVKMTHMPSITDHKTVGQIIIRNCVKIDSNGKVLGKWPDRTL